MKLINALLHIKILLFKILFEMCVSTWISHYFLNLIYIMYNIYIYTYIGYIIIYKKYFLFGFLWI